MPREPWRDRTAFAAQFLRSPAATASIWPSSDALGSAVADAAVGPARTAARTPARAGADRGAGAGGAEGPTIVELGAGSGTLSFALAQRLAGRGRLLAVELSEPLAHRLAERAPDIDVVPADVAELSTVLALRGLDRVDVLVSGLGWSATRPGQPDSLLSTVTRHLTDDGVFVQLAYTATRRAAPARALEREIRERFTSVTRSPVVWRNLPPAVVYRGQGVRR